MSEKCRIKQGKIKFICKKLCILLVRLHITLNYVFHVGTCFPFRGECGMNTTNAGNIIKSVRVFDDKT